MTELIIKVDDDFLREAKLKGMEEQFALVRCKDCKYRKKYNGEYHRCSVFERTIKNDDYCSFGERGDSDDES